MRLIDIVSAPWAITPDMFEEVQGVYTRHMRGEKIELTEVEAKLGRPLNNERRELQVTADGVAVIGLDGVLAKRMNLFMDISGGTSTELAAQQIQQALEDPAVRAIVLDIDSPGGTVDGTQELADQVFAARGVKPIVAVANGQMASAAYWIGSGADKVLMTSETTQVGSIGVVATHIDRSRLEKNAGVDRTEITAGRYKRLGTESGALTREGKAQLQAYADQVYDTFVSAVARNRGATADDVHARMADGRTFIGKKAIEAGLVDGISTLPDAIKTAAALAANSTTAALDGESTTAATQEEVTMNPTVESLKKDHPDVASALILEGRGALDAAVIAAKAEGVLAGAKGERDRIQAVLEQKMPGHEKLVNDLAFDGKTTGPEAAVAVLKAEKAKTAARLTDIEADAAAVAAPAALPRDRDPNAAAKADPHDVAKAAQAYQDEQKKLGRDVDDIEAVDHVMKRFAA